MVEWWRQLETGPAAVNRAIEREHQAAIAAGKAWPPERHSQPEAKPVPERESSPGPPPRLMASPARMTRQPGLTG